MSRNWDIAVQNYTQNKVPELVDITVNTYTYKHIVECQEVISTRNRSENKKLQGNGRSELF